MLVSHVPPAPKVQLNAFASPPESRLAPATKPVAARARLGRALKRQFLNWNALGRTELIINE
jgi:hypothetical protein